MAVHAFSFFLDKTSESFFALSQLLASGRPMINSLQNIAASSRSMAIRKAAQKASDLLQQGNTSAEVFRSPALNVFPAYARYILACPLSDQQKGKLLAGWMNGRVVFDINPLALFYPLQTFAVGVMCSTSLALLVLPQFREIMMGMKVKPPFFFELMQMFEISLFNPYFYLFIGFVGAVLLILALCMKRLFTMKKTGDYIALLSILKELPPEDRLKVFSVLGTPVLFQNEHKMLKTFSQELEQGTSLNEACDRAGLPLHLRWFVMMGFESENSSEMLEHGCMLFRSTWVAKMEMVMVVMEIVVMITMGLIFGLMLGSVFSAMNAILAVTTQ